MLKHVLAAATIGCAALAFSAANTPTLALPLVAEHLAADTGMTLVRRGHRSHGHGHRNFHRGHRFHGGIFFGAPLVYGYHGGSCAWLRHRALVTGSPYWWRRYRWCRGW